MGEEERGRRLVGRVSRDEIGDEVQERRVVDAVLQPTILDDEFRELMRRRKRAKKEGEEMDGR